MRTRSSISLPGLRRAVELVVDLDAVFVVDALEAGEVVVADRVLVAEVEGDLDQLVGGTSRPAWMIVTVPAPNSVLSRSASSLELRVAEPDQAGLGLGPLDLLAGLGGRGGAGRRGGLGRGCRRRTASPRALARIRSILLGALARPVGGPSAEPLGFDSGCGAGIFAAWAGRLARSTSPCAVRSAAISTVRRSIRSGPRTGTGMSRSTSPRYQGCPVPVGCRSSRRRSSSGA